MFAGAAREAVFSNPKVVQRIQDEFVPVALKAALVNNPPPGLEGDLYSEIARSKPAPQGICTANSSGKVLSWALSFDDEASILRFLDHVADRFHHESSPGDGVVAERFMKFPSVKLSDVPDNLVTNEIPAEHSADDRCLGIPSVEAGTLVGRIIGRALDDQGVPVADTLRQEHYMEARFEVPVSIQNQFVAAAKADGQVSFDLPDEFVRSLISHAFLGQLDVNPLGVVPGSRNKKGTWNFTGRRVASELPGITRVRISGTSDVEGGPDERGQRTDGRFWEHRVTLDWQGFVDIKEGRITEIGLTAHGDEHLRWGNARFRMTSESDVQHLMAGHPIDLDCSVRYAMLAAPAPAEEVAEAGTDRREDIGPDDHRRLQVKMRRLQESMKRGIPSDTSQSEIMQRMKRLDALIRARDIRKAEFEIDEILELLDK